MSKVEVDDYSNMVECHWQGSILYINPKTFFSILSMDETGERPYVRYETGAKMFDVSRGEFIKIAHEADAVHLHNNTAYVNSQKVCKYIESLDSQRQPRTRSRSRARTAI